MRKAESTFDNRAFFKIVTFLAVLAGCSALTENNDDKFCVIHVGPHKTGTSTLQALIYLGDTKGILAEDNYKHPVFSNAKMKNNAILASCFNRVYPELESKCPTEAVKSDVLDYFQSFVDNAANDSSNIIMSSEAFSYPGLNMAELTSYLLPHEYKIHVVVYYRRFYDWVYSYYNQFIKMRRVKHKISFKEWLTEEEFEDRLLSYSLALHNRFKEAPGIFNVTVVNMHEDPDNFDTDVTFACDHMDQAPHFCEVAKNNTYVNRNPSINLDWYIFVQKISSYHPIQLSKSDQRWEKIEEKFYQMTDFPKLCLSTEWQKKLLQTSLEAEKALTPESWHNSEEGLKSLMLDFEEKIKSKLCAMDIETILLSTEWQDFLTDLENDGMQQGL